MKIFYATNNYLGWKVLQEIIEKGADELVGMALHPVGKSKFADEIITTSGLDDSKIFREKNLNTISTQIHDLQPAILLSVNYGYKIKKQILSIFNFTVCHSYIYS